MIDLMTVGGSGGHFSPEYFDSLLIPRFPNELKEHIIKLYHSPISQITRPTSLENFVEYHRTRNNILGVQQLAAEMKVLQTELLSVQTSIIEGNSVIVPLN